MFEYDTFKTTTTSPRDNELTRLGQIKCQTFLEILQSKSVAYIVFFSEEELIFDDAHCIHVSIKIGGWDCAVMMLKSTTALC